eukprot:TRINITY_DN5043_c0_g1_i1.p1 TRINITY_DN5043_c0_g1~~TRINITY_DN5043_c0_g1_i1.p1  ORF type:complete len:967 (+),score=180.24 TRINITY_DN5043_c0_g1_i1:54-2903(+)
MATESASTLLVLSNDWGGSPGWAQGRPSHVARRLAAHAARRCSNECKEAARRRRQERMQQQVDRVAAHHDKVRRALQHRSTPRGSGGSRKQQMAEERRRRLHEAKAERLSVHHSRVVRAQSRSRETTEHESRLVKQAIDGYKKRGLQEVTTDAEFTQLRRQLISRDTMRAAQELLRMILVRLEKVEREEKMPFGEDTPVTMPSPMRFQRPAEGDPKQTAGMARELLSAYMTAGGIEDSADSAFAEAVASSARALLSTLARLMRLLETDAQAAGRETRHALRTFGKEWETYQAALVSWKKADKSNLIEHYMRVYGDVKRGRESVTHTHSPGRRESNHQELVAAIDDELQQLRTSIERLGGQGSLEELERRLQLVHAQSPAGTPASPPVTPPAARPPPISPPTATPTSALKVGDRVRLRGLVQAAHLNGSYGRVTGTQGERWGVKLENRVYGSKALKEANLEVVDDEPPRAREDGPLSDLRLRAKLHHDAAMRGAFRGELPTEASPQRVFAETVRNEAERAMWELLQDEVAHGLVERIGSVLELIKEEFLSVVPKGHRDALREELDDNLDWSVMRRCRSHDTLARGVRYCWEKIAAFGSPAAEEETRQRAADTAERIGAGAPGDLVPRELRAVLDAVRDLARSCDEERMSLAQPVLRRNATTEMRLWLNAEHERSGLPVTRQWIHDCMQRHLRSDEYTLPIEKEELLRLRRSRVCEVVPRAAIIDAVTAPKTADPCPEVLEMSRGILNDLASSVQRVTFAAATGALCGAHVHVSCAKQRKPEAVEEVKRRVATEMNDLLKRAQRSDSSLSLTDVVVRVVDSVDEALVIQGLPPLRDEQRRLLAGDAAQQESLGLIVRLVRQTEEGMFADRTMALTARRLRALISDHVFGEQVEIHDNSPFAPLREEVCTLCVTVAKVSTLLTDWLRPRTDRMVSDAACELSRRPALRRPSH